MIADAGADEAITEVMTDEATAFAELALAGTTELTLTGVWTELDAAGTGAAGDALPPRLNVWEASPTLHGA